MKGLLVLAALCPVFLAGPAVSPPGSYKCQEDQDQKAVDEAVLFINEHHRHGYKFKLAHVGGRSEERAERPCSFVLELTLDETVCHVLDPKPLAECEVRHQQEVNVTAKCNVTICGGGDEPGIKRFSCDTEPEPNEKIAMICPDCPALLPLNDSKGLESVHAAIDKYNNDTRPASYFRLLEVGRISVQYNPNFGMVYFAEFVVMETECSDKNATTNEKAACKPKCPHEATFGFCKSTNLGGQKLIVDCTVFKNSTHHPHPPFHHGKHCGHHKERPHPPGHHDHEDDETKKGPPVLDPPGHAKDFHSDCFRRSSHSFHHRGSHHHGHHRDHGRGRHDDHHGRGRHDDGHDDHHGRGRHDDGHDDHHGRGRHDDGHDDHPGRGRHDDRHDDHPGRGHHRGHQHEHEHDQKRPYPHPRPEKPHHSHLDLPEPRDHPQFMFAPCHGAVKIQPSIHPICPFPPKFHPHT